MRISVLCSSSSHPIYPWLERWIAQLDSSHQVQLVERKVDLAGGDILFLISCHEIIGRHDRARYRATLVVHSSDLPEGRGWSPHVWQVLEGRNEIVVSLLEAADSVDAGPIWAKRRFQLEGHELYDEINDKLFSISIELMMLAVTSFGTLEPKPQDDRVPTYYRRRTPEDSRIDPYQSIATQFNLLRVCDPDRFPAFFELKGKIYTIQLDKLRET
ncbi:MAG: formyltransferase family protein [Thermomicrobiales bacterium]